MHQEMNEAVNTQDLTEEIKHLRETNQHLQEKNAELDQQVIWLQNEVERLENQDGLSQNQEAEVTEAHTLLTQAIIQNENEDMEPDKVREVLLEVEMTLSSVWHRVSAYTGTYLCNLCEVREGLINWLIAEDEEYLAYNLEEKFEKTYQEFLDTKSVTT